jgi:dTDP-4-dehydrorhamnose reductase
LSAEPKLEVYGTLRSPAAMKFFNPSLQNRLLTAVDVENFDSLSLAFIKIKPDVAINCIGLVKQLAIAKDPLSAIPTNALLPHRLARICELAGVRLIHISTDCVFSGSRGNYHESDFADADDLYGRSKLLGEVAEALHAVTLRTSIIGHELNGNHGLVNWFLSQNDQVNGFTKAVFSGVPTVELARVINDYILPNTALWGLYQIASEPIDKCHLLQLIANAYQKKIAIIPSDQFIIDRSLNGTKFHLATGYACPKWPDLIALMRKFG